MANDTLFTLLQINDSMFPIGSFAHSYGLESYVNDGVVCDNDTAARYAELTLTHNIFYNDGAFLNKAYHYAQKKNAWQKLCELDELATALKAPSEIRNASQKLALRFLKLTSELDEKPLCRKYLNAIEENALTGHYSIALALYAAKSGISRTNTLTAFYYNSINGIVTNCAKMVPISQTIAQKILYSLQETVADLVKKQDEMPDDKIGMCCIGQEIKSMQHEKQYSRIYIS